MASVHFRDISNRDLINNTRELVRSATTLEVKLLYHLDEIHSRGLEGALGHKSAMQLCPSCHKQKTLHEFGNEGQTRELRRRVNAIDWLWYSRGAFIPAVS